MIQERQGSTTYGPAAEKMLAAFSQSREKHNGWFEHPDNPTFDWRVREDGSIFINSWTGRTEDEILAMGGLKRSDISLKETYPGPTRDSCDVLDLAIAKGIHPHILENFGLRSGYRYKGYSCVKVIYFNADGTQHTKIRVRKAIEGKYKQCWDEDTPGEIIPYGLHKLDIAHEAGYLSIGEGESDGWACWHNSIPYLGLPGVDTQKTLKHLNVSILPPKIYILLEPDQKQRLLENGQSFYKNVHRELRKNDYQGQIFCIDFGKTTGHKDPSALHIALWKEGKAEQFKECMRQAMEQAIPANDMQDESSTFDIQDERVLGALKEKRLQDLYALAPEIADMGDMEQQHIKLAAHDIWGKDFPSRDFEGLLRVAKLQNERERQPGPDFITARDLMKLHFDPVDFVVPEILPTGLIVLGGKQKIGKSWLDLDLCISVATGGIALSRYKIKQDSSVLYMALEDHQRRLQDRMSQILAPGSEAPESLEIVTQWRRMDEGGLIDLEDWIKQHPKARLVVIDPWVLVKPKIKGRPGETGYDADYEALKGIKKLADTYKLCILIQFHLRKQIADDPFDELNATTGVTACADGFISLKRTRGESDGTLFASGRDYKEEVNLALSFKDGRWKVLGDGASAIYYALSQERRAIIDFLGIAITPMPPKDIAVLVYGTEDSSKARKLLYKMKEDGQVKWVEEDKEKGIKEGYVSLIPSPKQEEEEEKKKANCVDTVDSIDSIDSIDAGDGSPPQAQKSHSAVSNESERLRDESERLRDESKRLRGTTSIDGAMEEPIEPFLDMENGHNVPSVPSVYGVYADSDNEKSGSNEENIIPFPNPSSQNSNTAISLEIFWALGKKRGYPEIPDLDLKGGMGGWNSFSLTHRIRIPDVIARLGGAS